MKGIDETDRRIIAILGRDGRLGNNEMARELGVSEGTVRHRVARLRSEGLLRVCGLVEADSSSEKQLAYLGVKIAVSKNLNKIAERISRLEDVLSASIATGRYDIIVEVWVDVKHGLIKFLDERLAKVDGIVSTESFLAMKSYEKWICEEKATPSRPD